MWQFNMWDWLYNKRSVFCFSWRRSCVLSATMASRCLLYFSICRVWKVMSSCPAGSDGKMLLFPPPTIYYSTVYPVHSARGKVTRFIIISTGLTLCGFILSSTFLTCSNVGLVVRFWDQHFLMSCKRVTQMHRECLLLKDTALGTLAQLIACIWILILWLKEQQRSQSTSWSIFVLSNAMWQYHH